MGCDIHLYAEQRINGKWHLVKTFESIHTDATNVDKKHWRVMMRASGRNYSFFAALAGVRNYDGIDAPEPKGLPDDVSELTAIYSDGYGSDGHSRSWSTAEEFARAFFEHHLSQEEQAELTAKKLKCDTDMTAAILERFVGIDVPYEYNSSTGLCEYKFDDLRFVYWFDN